MLMCPMHEYLRNPSPNNAKHGHFTAAELFRQSLQQSPAPLGGAAGEASASRLCFSISRWTFSQGRQRKTANDVCYAEA